MPFVRVVFSCSDVIPLWIEGVNGSSDLVKSHCEDVDGGRKAGVQGLRGDDIVMTSRLADP